MAEECLFGVYIVTNKVNGKRYVGQTTLSVRARWSQHIRESQRGIFSSPLFHRAIAEYGVGAFSVKSISLPNGSSQQDLDSMEIWLIAQLKTLKPNGYNLKQGGHGGPHAEETKIKIGNAHRGMKRSPEALMNMSAWQKGKKKHTPEAKERIRLSMLGRVVTAETRAKLSAAKKGKPSPLIGRKRGPMSLKQREKLSAIKTGSTLSDQHKRNIGIKSKELWATAEYRSKVVGAQQGRIVSDETREKISIRRKAYWKRYHEARGLTNV